eukprot:GHVN01068201.1.p1 GENE.GHVN01068201.1~~GHVN01068201.1.p1  ORF type:complete len:942 (+),score=106.02 GHVN01068201.1:205-2826(+)
MLRESILYNVVIYFAIVLLAVLVIQFIFDIYDLAVRWKRENSSALRGVGTDLSLEMKYGRVHHMPPTLTLFPSNGAPPDASTYGIPRRSVANSFDEQHFSPPVGNVSTVQFTVPFCPTLDDTSASPSQADMTRLNNLNPLHHNLHPRLSGDTHTRDRGVVAPHDIIEVLSSNVYLSASSTTEAHTDLLPSQSETHDPPQPSLTCHSLQSPVGSLPLSSSPPSPSSSFHAVIGAQHSSSSISRPSSGDAAMLSTTDFLSAAVSKGDTLLSSSEQEMNEGRTQVGEMPLRLPSQIRRSASIGDASPMARNSFIRRRMEMTDETPNYSLHRYDSCYFQQQLSSYHSQHSPRPLPSTMTLDELDTVVGIYFFIQRARSAVMKEVFDGQIRTTRMADRRQAISEVGEMGFGQLAAGIVADATLTPTSKTHWNIAPNRRRKTATWGDQDVRRRSDTSTYVYRYYKDLADHTGDLAGRRSTVRTGTAVERFALCTESRTAAIGSSAYVMQYLKCGLWPSLRDDHSLLSLMRWHPTSLRIKKTISLTVFISLVAYIQTSLIRTHDAPSHIWTMGLVTRLAVTTAAIASPLFMAINAHIRKCFLTPLRYEYRLGLMPNTRPQYPRNPKFQTQPVSSRATNVANGPSNTLSATQACPASHANGKEETKSGFLRWCSSRCSRSNQRYNLPVPPITLRIYQYFWRSIGYRRNMIYGQLKSWFVFILCTLPIATTVLHIFSSATFLSREASRYWSIGLGISLTFALALFEPLMLVVWILFAAKVKFHCLKHGVICGKDVGPFIKFYNSFEGESIASMIYKRIVVTAAVRISQQWRRILALRRWRLRRINAVTKITAIRRMIVAQRKYRRLRLWRLDGRIHEIRILK